MQSAPSLEHELLNPPTDGVSAVEFANSSNMLLVSSWDRKVRLYNATQNSLTYSYEHKGAVLDCAFHADDTKVYSGGLDCKLTMCDLHTQHETNIGSHAKPIRCVIHNAATNCIITGSWDSTIKLWDPRAHTPLVGQYDQPGKVYSMDQNTERLVVATSGRHVCIYNLRALHKAESTRESSLLHQTRCVRCFPDGTGYALSSIEARVAIEYFDMAPAVQAKKYAFKCHRTKEQGVQKLYPVNAIAFHPGYGTFATGGADRCVNVWDGAHKKRICQYPAYPTGIAALSFNHDGSLLAIAASYTYEQGEKDHPSDSVYIRTINDHEVRPKTKKAK